MKNTVVQFLLVLISLAGYSQKYKLGEVTIAELKEKVHPKDTTASAAYLFKKGRVYFEYSQHDGFEVVTEIQVKIKIYKSEGLDWANQKIKYYTETGLKEIALISDGATYNLVDGKVVKSKLKSEGEFDEKINKYWNQKRITMPNVKPGSIIEFKFVVKSPNFGSLKDWNFQSSIPVNYVELVTEVPEYFMYNVNQKGYLSPKVSEEKVSRSITLTSSGRSGGNSFGNGNVSSSIQRNDVSFTEVRTSYKSENLPALKDEAYVNNLENYISSISFELSMTKFPNSPLKNYSTDWATIVKKIYDNEDFGGELTKINYFEENIKTAMAGVTSRDEKIVAIFDHVKANVKWNGYYGYACDEGVKSAYKNKIGNVAEINLMLIAMLRYAGFDSNPVILSTRSNGVPLFPSRTAFNYVVAAIQTSEGITLLDATDKYGYLNVLPERALNWSGRLIKPNGTSEEVNLFPNVYSKNIINLMASVKEDGTVTGKIRNQYFNHYAKEFRDNYAEKTEESYLEELENDTKGIEISDYKLFNKTDLTKQVVEEYGFTHKLLVEKISDKLYINPMLFLAATRNPFVLEKREYPIDFTFPKQDKYMISIALPEGYVLESVPQSASIAMDENIGTFTYNISNIGNQLQLSVTQEINWTVVPATYYEIVKNFYKSLVVKQTEKVVLKKA